MNWVKLLKNWLNFEKRANLNMGPFLKMGHFLKTKHFLKVRHFWENEGLFEKLDFFGIWSIFWKVGHFFSKMGQILKKGQKLKILKRASYAREMLVKSA